MLGDRWTPLIIRELTMGAARFNEIHRGIPRVSRTLLAQRLRTLERRGLIHRDTADRARGGPYTLTPAGDALSPIVWAMGHWAAEWMFTDPTEEICDGLSLIWRMHQHAEPAKLPREQTIVHLVLTGDGGAEGWLDIDAEGMTVCKDDQGKDVDLAVEADTAHMYRWLMGMVAVHRPRRGRTGTPARAQPPRPRLPFVVQNKCVRRRPAAIRTPKPARAQRLTRSLDRRLPPALAHRGAATRRRWPTRSAQPDLISLT